MTVVPLVNSSAHPDGWHDVRSPGGYEWWYFDAEDPATDTQVVAIFMQGFIFHPGYLRQYARFHRRPTKHRPPIAADFPSVYLCVYRGGRIWKQFFTEYKPTDFAAHATRCDVRLGDTNSARQGDRGYELKLVGTPWQLTGRGPIRLTSETLSARLDFVPIGLPLEPTERTFLSWEMTGADHRWTIAAPRCDVSGTITLSRVGGTDESLTFRGRGYHDHNYGSAPIGDGLHRWTWGRAMFGEHRVITFHHAEPRERSLRGETHLVEATPAGLREIPAPDVVGDWSLVCNPAMRLRYPKSLDFGDALRLSNPRVIDPSPFYLRLQFDAESFGDRATAFCELAYPHRVRWPILGRMIEMSFDKRLLR